MSKNRVRAAVCNNMGHVRKNNEDNFYLNGKYMPLKQMDAGGTFTCEGAGMQIYAVCDGMGGGEAGEEASCMVVEALAGAMRSGIHSVQELCNILQATSNKIHRKHSGMSGSTIALLALSNGHVLALNVGDSRIYRLRNGKFKQISLDQVGVQAHSITQYLGLPEDEPLEPYMRMDDIGEWTVGTDSETVYLLCSDGITDMVDNLDIRNILLSEPSPEAAAQSLVAAALRHGGKDNATAMVVRVPQDMITDNTSKRFHFWMILLQLLTGAGALGALIMIIRLLLLG